MKNQDKIQAISGKLFREESANVYAILDGASVPGLLSKISEHKPEHLCLYIGDIEPDLAEVAPYLVRLDRTSKFTDLVLGEGWGKHWGIFAVSQSDLRTLHKHFRKFLMVHTFDGKPLYFRYYDPRVLRVYLPTCNEDELKTVFGPIQLYLLEDEDPNTALRFSNISSVLKQDKLPLNNSAPS
jgi:hypothetical protein